MKTIFGKLKRFLTDEQTRFGYLNRLGFYRNMPDEEFLKKAFEVKLGYLLDLKNPRTFNEKLQWLKLYYRRPELTVMADKVKVRDWIAQELGEEYLIPSIGVWSNPEEIDFEALPARFVLKCNHNSGLGMCICKDKVKLDIPRVRAGLRKGLDQDYYLTAREWPYRDIPRRILGEQFIEDPSGDLKDYKFFCFDGFVDSVMVCSDRGSGDTKFYFFDKDWALVRCNKRGLAAPEGFTLPKPANMDRMFEIAAQLSKGLPYVRVDLYNVNGKIYFGEMTFFPDSGFDSNLLPQTDRNWGELIRLPQKTKASGEK